MINLTFRSLVERNYFALSLCWYFPSYITSSHNRHVGVADNRKLKEKYCGGLGSNGVLFIQFLECLSLTGFRRRNEMHFSAEFFLTPSDLRS